MNLTTEKNEELLAYQKIVKEVKQGLIKGDLEPGDKLLSERKLAEKLNVGRPTIREAFKVLESFGMVEIRQGGGTYIKEISIEDFIEPMTLILLQDNKSILDFMEARIIIEVRAVKLAVDRATQGDLLNIKEAANENKKAIENIDGSGEYAKKANKHDIRYHKNIVEACHNSVLSKFMSLLTNIMTQEYIPYKEIMNKRDHAKKYAEQHIQIYKSIKDKKPQQAANKMRSHLTKAKQEIEELQLELF